MHLTKKGVQAYILAIAPCAKKRRYSEKEEGNRISSYAHFRFSLVVYMVKILILLIFFTNLNLIFL